MELFKKFLYWTAVGLFAYMPFHIFLSQYLSTVTGGLDAWKIAKDIVTAILVSALVCTVLITRKFTRQYLYFVGFAVVYLVLHIVSWFGTGQPNDTGSLATIYNNRLVWYLLIGYSIALLFPDKQVKVQFAKILVAASAVVCLIGFAQWVLPKDVMTHFGYSIERGVKPNFFIDDKPDFPRVFSTIRDPNSLGAFLLLPSTIILLSLLRFWRTKQRMLLAGLLLLHYVVILMTFSRSAWIALALTHGLVVAALFRRQIMLYGRKYAIPLGVLAVMVLGGLYVARDNYFVQNVILHSDESTQMADPNELRVQLYDKAIDGIEDNPEGNGPGTAGLVSTRLNTGGLLTENYYLQIAYEVGVVGLALFLVFQAYILKLLWTGRHRSLNQALLASFIGLAFVNLLIHGWSNEALAVGWFILAGLAIVQQRQGSLARDRRAESDSLAVS